MLTTQLPRSVSEPDSGVFWIMIRNTKPDPGAKKVKLFFDDSTF